MKTSPANGSARSACCTSAANPSMPLRKSTGSAASRMRTPGGTAITPAPAPPRAPGAAPPRRSGRGRVEALGHDPGLLLVGPAAATADAGDHLEPAEAVVRTS